MFFRSLDIMRSFLVGAVLFCCCADGRSVRNHNRATFAISNGTALRILPLGDSITHGYLEPSENSYRKELSCMLYNGGNGVQYIGSLSSGNWSDNAHDGFDGRRIEEIASMGHPEITGELQPNVVLIHAGSNDMVQDYDVANAPSRLGALIDQINTANPSGLIIVAEIIANNDTLVNSRVKAFNKALPAVIATRSSAGKPVRLVLMEDLKPAEDTFEGLHPNEKGYHKMATAWFAAIEKAGQEGMITPITGNFTNGGAAAC